MDQEVIAKIKAGGVGVMPTDTIYGLACSVFSETALGRMFDIKGRSVGKPPVVIISELSDLLLFGVELNDFEKSFVAKYWPGAVTIILNIKSDLHFLDQGLGLAIRLPANEKIRDFLKLTGPLATTSANPEGQLPAKNVTEAKKYFGPSPGRAGDTVDFYMDGGEIDGPPSTLVRLKNGKIEVLRDGVVKIN